MQAKSQFCHEHGQVFLETRELSREYKTGGETVHALCDISFKAYQGDFTVINGPSGSGKTTFLNMISLIDQPTQGDVLLEGASTRTLTDKQLANLLRALGETARAEKVLETPRARIGELAAENAACIAAHMKTRTADDWEKLLNEAHEPASRVRTIDEALAHEQVRSRGVMQAAGDAPLPGGPSRFPVAAFTYAHGSPSLDRPPPRLSEHTAQVLGELGYDETRIAVLRQAGAV